MTGGVFVVPSVRAACRNDGCYQDEGDYEGQGRKPTKQRFLIAAWWA